MRTMTVEELYEYLRSPQFLHVNSGNIFYNYYLYQYPADTEYKMREQIHEFKKRLERPTSYEDALVLDLFEVFCDYLRSEKFGEQTLLDDTFEEDKSNPDTVTQELTDEANSDAFISFVHDRITEHISAPSSDDKNKTLIFVHGIGKMFPYLRTNVFLTRYEKYNDPNSYKIVLFYPGHQEKNSFSLFDRLDDAHTYRAILLVNK